jgi:hypothetical protein
MEGLYTLFCLAIIDNQGNVHLRVHMISSTAPTRNCIQRERERELLLCFVSGGGYLGRPLRDHLDVKI